MYHYLALGDSYTIGEQVDPADNFPSQTTALLAERYGIVSAPPHIIAVTGWTTDELATGIEQEGPANDYDWATLSIGVNNQYRGRDLDNFKEEYTDLLSKAITFAKGNPKRVFVLSIPDWGLTPFAHDRDGAQIAKEIDAFNKAKKEITLKMGAHFLDITEESRRQGKDDRYLAMDKLHYSAEAYKEWALLLAPMIADTIKSTTNAS